MSWQPHVTVAAVVERDGRFLVVDEDVEGTRLLNQPAGHWEPGETLFEAAVRETLEETGYGFVPESLVGIYAWTPPEAAFTYLRFTFAGRVGDVASRPSDAAIVRVLWLSPDELRASANRHRGPQVLRSVDDFLTGRRFPLEVLAQV